MKGEDSTSINTLTKLYYELTLYLIRRELTRMCLVEHNLNINSLLLNDNEYSEESIEQLTNRFTSLEFLYFSGIHIYTNSVLYGVVGSF